MKRLTAISESGKAYYPYCFREDTCDGCGSSEKCDQCELSLKVCETLAAYENTGLTPPEIMELKERDTAMEINEILAEQRITAIKAWKSVKDDGLPPVGSCLIVTIKNHGYGGRRELRYPVHYLEKNYAPGYAFYMNGTDILLPEYSEVVAWMPIPMPYEGE